MRAGCAACGVAGLILGDNRIALLTQRVLQTDGFGLVPICDTDQGGELEADSMTSSSRRAPLT